MCPSWKGTRERRHSPKGRAQLIREWCANSRHWASTRSRRVGAAPRPWVARLPAALRNTLARRRGEPDFSHDVKEALDGCLACKSCTGQCPIKVDVPDLPFKVLRALLRTLSAPLRDYVVGSIGASRPG